MKTLVPVKKKAAPSVAAPERATPPKNAIASAPSAVVQKVTSVTLQPKPHLQQRIDEGLTSKALTALLKHHANSIDPKKSLLGTDVAVHVQFGLEVAPGRARTKPIRLSLPNPLYKLSPASDDGTNDDSALDEPEVCLIVKEESKEQIQAMIADFPQHMGCIKKVLGLQSLRTKHAEFKQRRDLLARFTCFLADDRILPMLTSALGKDFLAAKKQPIPIRINRKEALPFAIQKALSATYLHIPEGTCVAVRVGFTSMTTEKLVQNVMQVCQQVGKAVPRKWANIRSIAIKLPESTALPIYNKTPAELSEIAKMAGLSSAWKSMEESHTERLARLEAAATKRSDEDSKKRKKENTPLLRALKKQKKSKANMVESDSPDVVDDEKAGDEPKSKALPVTKRSEATSRMDVIDKSAGATSVAKKVNKSDAASKIETENVKAAGIQVKELTKATSNSDVNSSDASVRKRKDGDKNKNDSQRPPGKATESAGGTFLAAKRFDGSKEGYVFKNGPKGLGYYCDVKPVVNKAALEALARIQPNQRQQRGGNRSKASNVKTGGKKRRR
jgi:ribosome biogenesis protein UTP30